MYKRQLLPQAERGAVLLATELLDIRSTLLRARSIRNVLTVSYTHLRAHETVLDLVCRLLLEKKKQQKQHTYHTTIPCVIIQIPLTTKTKSTTYQCLTTLHII